MRQIINDCVCCEIPCIGGTCPYSKREVEICEMCGETEAIYYADGVPVCEECIVEEMKEQFYDMTVYEQAEALGITLRDIES